MKENPYSDRYEQACEHLRLALSLLSEHRLSPSPLNYRIGYDIVILGGPTQQPVAHAAPRKQGRETGFPQTSNNFVGRLTIGHDHNLQQNPVYRQ